MSFLKEEHGGRLRSVGSLFEKRFDKTLLLVSRWTHALGGASEISCSLGGILGGESPNTFVGAALRESRRDNTARP
jgi:hypothetical protein